MFKASLKDFRVDSDAEVWPFSILDNIETEILAILDNSCTESFFFFLARRMVSPSICSKRPVSSKDCVFIL